MGPCQCKFGNPGLWCSIYTILITSNLFSLLYKCNTALTFSLATFNEINQYTFYDHGYAWCTDVLVLQRKIQSSTCPCMTYNHPHGLMFDMYITIGTGKQLWNLLLSSTVGKTSSMGDTTCPPSTHHHMGLCDALRDSASWKFLVHFCILRCMPSCCSGEWLLAQCKVGFSRCMSH